MIRSLDLALGGVMALLIRGYQRYLSPYKGFRCAHRALHGGDSCSEFGRETFASEGWRRGVARLQGRFRACRDASRSLGSIRKLALSEGGVFDEQLDTREKGMPASKPAHWTGGCVWDATAQCCAESAGDAGCSAASGFVHDPPCV